MLITFPRKKSLKKESSLEEKKKEFNKINDSGFFVVGKTNQKNQKGKESWRPH